ncbi:MAG TPA: SHOCT domain-containing protein [Aggregatilineaceae bacterium]|nr:SHOCT domain-containing protein [Aggregatilineaceae bacterium]
MWYPRHEFGWGGLIFGVVLTVAFWGVLVMLGVLLFRALTGPRGRHDTDQIPPAGQSKTALDILKERYARGEITKDEYEQMREVLLR